MKPHIYFHRYSKNLGFWMVSRTPVRWIRLTDSERLDIHAAHTFVTRLNGELS